MWLGPEGRKQMKELGGVSTIGIEIAVSILIGIAGGQWLDEKFETEPLFFWLGLLAGLVAGFRSLYRLARKTQHELRKQQEQDRELPPSSARQAGPDSNASQ